MKESESKDAQRLTKRSLILLSSKPWYFNPLGQYILTVVMHDGQFCLRKILE